MPGEAKSVKRFERSNGLDTALYKKLPLPLCGKEGDGNKSTRDKDLREDLLRRRSSSSSRSIGGREASISHGHWQFGGLHAS